jgi:hypothetical protein
VEVELEGFDEAGIIGENLRFVRVGIEKHNELRPFIYNLLHFGSVVMTKSMLRGHPAQVQKAYVRAVTNDPAIDLNYYAFPPVLQLDLLRSFTISEFNRLMDKRRELIEHIEMADLKEVASNFIDFLRVKYSDPWGYIERFIKSYGHRMVFEDLVKSSRVLRDRFVTDYKICTYVDGGYPLVFWSEDFLHPIEINGPNRYSKERTPVFGISNGDEYFPVVCVAGNVATITNRFYEMIYPQSVKEIQPSNLCNVENYCKQYQECCERPKFFSRLLFMGEIDANLQYLIPFILYRRYGHYIHEPLRVKYDERGSFKTFYKRFRGNSENDIVVCGKIREGNLKEKSMYEECLKYGLKIIDPKTYYDEFEILLNEITDEAKGTNLDRLSLERISTKIDKTKKLVKESLI